MRYPTANGYIALGWPKCELHNSTEPLSPVVLDSHRLRCALWDAFTFGTTQHFQDGFYEVAVRWGGIIIYDVQTGHIVRSDNFDDAGRIARMMSDVRTDALVAEGGAFVAGGAA